MTLDTPFHAPAAHFAGSPDLAAVSASPASSPSPCPPAPASFVDFATRLRRELAPASLLELVLVDRVVLASWRLQVVSASEQDTARAGESLGAVGRETLQAECSLETALALLQNARNAGRPAWGRRSESEPAAYGSSAGSPLDHAGLDLPDLSNEWTFLPAEDGDDDAPAFAVDDLEDADFLLLPTDDDDDNGNEPETDDGPAPPRWQDRLVFDFSISETSPVVKGTWVTVSQVVSCVVDGWTWSDILRAHPELTEDDVRTCLLYTLEQDNGQGA